METNQPTSAPADCPFVSPRLGPDDHDDHGAALGWSEWEPTSGGGFRRARSLPPTPRSQHLASPCPACAEAARIASWHAHLWAEWQRRRRSPAVAS
jgi:hypothetical protein